MTRPLNLVPLLVVLASCTSTNDTSDTGTDTGDDLPFSEDSALQIVSASVDYEPALDSLVFEVVVAGDAASAVPTPVGGVDGAPVLGYVFPTTLSPAKVGFADVAGTLALAVTSHPDFDDTPYWDEDQNAAYDDDGIVYHAHWVVLAEDERALGGLAVVQAGDDAVLPPTAPMPMYLDSPGFTVVEDGSTLRVVVPADRVQRDLGFEVGALTAYMEVTLAYDTPLLAVHGVLSALDDGATTMVVSGASGAPESAWPVATVDASDASLDVLTAGAVYLSSVDMFVFTQQVDGLAATQLPVAAGQVDGAPVLGYVFPTDILPSVVGFSGLEDGTLALAVTSHPDFGDTPLFDENLDGIYTNDGATYHVHWAVLEADDDSAAGLSVPSQTDPSMLPPTAPMPMYLDSPGYHAFASGDSLHVLVPGWHLAGTDFAFDALTARMRVDASGDAPVLRVEEVVSLLSGDLSLPLSPVVE